MLGFKTKLYFALRKQFDKYFSYVPKLLPFNNFDV